MKINLTKTMAKISLVMALAGLPAGIVSTAVQQPVMAARRRHMHRYRRRLNRRERAAKRWIAMHESGGRYNARNGQCYGRYQLLIGYLHGDLSPRNQERAADRYVHARYRTWTNAKKFWQLHHWY